MVQGGSQNEEEKGRPGACKNTCVIEGLGAWTESVGRHQSSFSTRVFTDSGCQAGSKVTAVDDALGFLSGVFFISLLVTGSSLASITASLSASLTFGGRPTPWVLEEDEKKWMGGG